MMTTILADVSNALTAVVSGAGAGIARVDGRRRLPASGIVWSPDGLIMTAEHVIRRDENISVGLPDGSSVAARLIGRDRTTDVAMLKVEAAGLVPFTESDKNTLGVGALVLALGRPGNTVQATYGIISAMGESWRTRMGGQIDRYLQSDVLMYPGFSGGPLVDTQGHLVGLNSSELLPGVSLAIPVPTLARVAESLLAHGRVRRGYLGINSQGVRLPKSAREELGQDSGLLVVSVETDSPAEAAGITLGDTLVGIAGSTIRHHNDLMAQLTGDRVGTTIPLQLLRGGQLITLDVTVGERP
jgi:S1-C subfamily serine protease